MWSTASNTQGTCNAHLQENRQMDNLITFKETVVLGPHQNETQKFGQRTECINCSGDWDTFDDWQETFEILTLIMWDLVLG